MLWKSVIAHMTGQSAAYELSCGILTGIILTGWKTAQYRAEEMKAFLNKSPLLVSVGVMTTIYHLNPWQKLSIILALTSHYLIWVMPICKQCWSCVSLGNKSVFRFDKIISSYIINSGTEFNKSKDWGRFLILGLFSESLKCF